MAAMLCPVCRTRWPHDAEFRECPRCEKRCEPRPGMDPQASLAEARSEARRMRFERFYARREVERTERGEPTPEEIGEREAREEIAVMRRLEQELRGAG